MRVAGIDGGIASVGWAVLDFDAPEQVGSIVAAGTRMFDTPETDKERRPKSELRRMYRGQRRVIRRRRQRMTAVRRLFQEFGLMADAGSDALKRPGLDPWALRADALDRMISGPELAVALGHIARHRGFRSNAKARGENADDDSKMKAAMRATQDKMAGRTFGQFMVSDQEFGKRKRNREGDYARTPLRDDLEWETRAIFSAQRRLQNPLAAPELEARFSDIAFFQRGMPDSESKVGMCAFEPDERRTAKRGYSFELFRYLSRLNALEIQTGRQARRLTAEELGKALTQFGASKTISFKSLRKLLKLGDEDRFATVRPAEEGNDVVARQGKAAEGTATLRGILQGSAWDSLVKTPEKLDRIAEVISFRDDLGSIRAGLEETGIEPLIVEALMQAVEAGAFDAFTGSGHISSKACRAIIPYLMQGLVYSAAAEKCGYDHTASRERHAFDVGVTGKHALKRILSQEKIDQALVGSPVARKALIEAVKQVKAVVEEYGVPDAIHIELARDVGKGIEERQEIERGIEKRNKEKERLRGRFAEDVGRAPVSGEEMLRYELWLQQNWRCVYCDKLIEAPHLVAADNTVQVDHILPWSRFGDDSFDNKTLCHAKCNQDKRGKTPYEWLGHDSERWDAYVAGINGLASLKRHKRKLYTLKNADELAEKFRSRNLNDTRWTCRLLAEALKAMYPKDEGKRRVFTRPGALTNRLRQAWGLHWLKKDEAGERIPDDRHHALDAIIVAATTEAQLHRLTLAFQQEEAKGSPRDFRAFAPPWPGFREEAERAVNAVFVSRAERRRARGEAHAATIRSVSERDGEKLVFERKRVGDLKPADLDRVKDPERNRATIEALRAWLEANKPTDKPPLSPNGDAIAKVTLLTNKKPDVIVREGAVDRGDMARVDVFRKANKKGVFQHFLVPIYPHQIAAMEEPPDRCVPGDVPISAWPGRGEPEFLFSLNSMALIEVAKPDGEVIRGYFRGLDRNTGAINLSPHENMTIVRRSIGPRTLLAFRKLVVDRLGRISECPREVRTWRGKACTSANPPA